MIMNTKRAREAEIYLDAAGASDGGLLLLLGESGTGKTFFLRRLREAAEAAAVGPIHAAAADEFESEIPYSFIERLMSTTPAARTAIDPAHSRIEIAREVLLSLSGHPKGTIRTVLLDDVHWVDAASERVLRYVAPRLVSQGVFLVCSARPQPGVETLAWHLSDEAQLHANWRTVEFTKLSVSDIREMALERFGTGISAKTAERIQTVTDGSFSRVSSMFDGLSPEEIQGLHLRSDLPARLYQQHDGEQRLLPDHQMLNDAGRLAVEIVALAAETIDSATVAHVAEMLGDPVDAAWAVRQGLLVEVDFGDRLAAAHPLLTASVSENLSESRAQEILHALASHSQGHRSLVFELRAAKALTPELEARVRDDVTASLGQGDLGLVGETLRRCLDLTTGEARDEVLIELTLHYLQHKAGFLVLDLLPEVEALPATPLRECIAILLRVYRFEDQVPRERIDALLGVNDPSPEMRTLQAFVSFLAVIAIMRSRDAEGLLEFIPRAKELWALAPESPEELTDERIRWMVAPREYELILDGYSLVPLMIESRTEHLAALLPQAIERAKALRPSEHKIDVIVSLVGTLISLNTLDTAYELAHEGYELLEGRPRPWAGGGMRITYAHLLALRGELTEALRVVTDAEERAHEFLDAEVRLTLSALHAWLAAVTGTEDPAPYLLGAQRLYQLHWEGYGIDLVLIAEVEIASLAGNHREVIALTEPGRYRSFTSTRHGFLTYRALSLIELARFDEAAVLIERLRGLDGAEWHETYGTISWLEARLADSRPESHATWAEIDALYRAAAETTELPLYRARTLRDHGRAAVAHGEPDKATPLFTESKRIFTELGTRPDLETLAAEEHLLRDAVHTQEAAAAMRLTSREREIAELIANGGSTSDIAQTLVISPATVRFHVSNVLAKLGLTSRGEIAHALRGPIT